MKIHELKTLPQYFADVKSGNKTFEIRKNDRNYMTGDILILREYDDLKNNFTGETLIKQVPYIFYGGKYGIDDKFCILSLKDFTAAVENLKVFAFENGETDWIIATCEEEAKAYYITVVGLEEMQECNISEMVDWHNSKMRLEVSEKQLDETYWRKETMLNVAKEMYGSNYTGATIIATTCAG